MRRSRSSRRPVSNRAIKNHPTKNRMAVAAKTATNGTNVSAGMAIFLCSSREITRHGRLGENPLLKQPGGQLDAHCLQASQERGLIAAGVELAGGPAVLQAKLPEAKNVFQHVGTPA